MGRGCGRGFPGSGQVRARSCASALQAAGEGCALRTTGSRPHPHEELQGE